MNSLNRLTTTALSATLKYDCQHLPGVRRQPPGMAALFRKALSSARRPDSELSENCVLNPDKTMVQPTANDELLVRSGLADMAAFEDDDLVGIANG